MPKRFTDTEIWKNQRWFRRLKPSNKLVFFYLKDTCNHAGVWEINLPDLKEDTGLKNFELAQFIADVNKDIDKISGKPIQKQRVFVHADKYLVLSTYIQFQYQRRDLRVSPAVAAVYSALSYLQAIGVLDKLIHKGYITLSDPFGSSSDETDQTPETIPAAPVSVSVDPERTPAQIVREHPQKLQVLRMKYGAGFDFDHAMEQWSLKLQGDVSAPTDPKQLFPLLTKWLNSWVRNERNKTTSKPHGTSNKTLEENLKQQNQIITSITHKTA